MLKFSLKSRNGHPVEFWLFENNIFMVWGWDIARFVALGRQKISYKAAYDLKWIL